MEWINKTVKISKRQNICHNGYYWYRQAETTFYLYKHHQTQKDKQTEERETMAGVVFLTMQKITIKESIFMYKVIIDNLHSRARLL